MKVISMILINVIVLALSIFSLLFLSAYLYEKPFSYRPSAYLPVGIFLLGVAWAFFIYLKYIFNPQNWLRSIAYFIVYFVVTAGVISAALYFATLAIIFKFGL